MKKYICILAGAALLVACEQKTETVAPAPGAPPESKTENNTTIVNPSPAGGKTTHTDTTNTSNTSTSTASTPAATSSPATVNETSTSTSTTESSPNP